VDITTIVGLISGFTLLIMGILNGGDLPSFVDVPSLLIVVGGSCAAFLVSFPLADVVRFSGILRYAFFLPGPYKRLAYPGRPPSDSEVDERAEEGAAEIVAELKLGIVMLRRLRTYALAFGGIAVLVGLILMLKNLDDPSAIGPGIAMALISPFYGAVIAYLICLPFQTKLARRLEALQQ